MGNTITNMEQDAYVALNTVMRERVGLIGCVTRDSRADAVAKNAVVHSFVTPVAGTPQNFTPSMSDPGAADETFGDVEVALDRLKYLDFSWSGEEEYAADQTFGHLSPQQQQIAQRMRRIVNDMEADLWAAMYKGASRAYGAAATKPFATSGNLTDFAMMQKILDDNGVGDSERYGVLSTTAALNLIGLQSQAQMSGDTSQARRGVLLDYAGFAIKRSGQIGIHTAGTGTAYDVNQVATPPVAGDTQIAFDTGSGTVLAGDVIVNAESGRDDNKYLVGTELGGGHLHINGPGLRLPWNDGDTITLTANYTPNLFFARSGAILVTRLPKFPQRGDKATDVFNVTDPESGLSFMIRYYPGTGMGVYRMFAMWGVKVLDSAQIAVLIS